MPCCPKALGEFFEHGIGKFLLILIVILLSFYSIYFTVCTFRTKDYPPNTFIEFKQDQDFFLGKNEADYRGYIRFETSIKRYPESEQKQVSIAKIVLELDNDTRLMHGVKIELFDRNHAFISELLLQKKAMTFDESNYSYNILDLKLPEGYPIDTVKCFRYNFIKETAI